MDDPLIAQDTVEYENNDNDIQAIRQKLDFEENPNLQFSNMENEVTMEPNQQPVHYTEDYPEFHSDNNSCIENLQEDPRNISDEEDALAEEEVKRVLNTDEEHEWADFLDKIKGVAGDIINGRIAVVDKLCRLFSDNEQNQDFTAHSLMRYLTIKNF